MRKCTVLAVAAALLALAGSVRAATIEASSTTMLNVAKQTRDGAVGGTPNLVSTAPAFELISITARGLQNPVADDLTIVLSTWGSIELDDRRWDNGTNGDLTGDVMTGYVQGRLVRRHLTFRIGREQVQTGVARMLHIDGAEAIASLPGGFRLSGYVGSPVSQRFTTRTGIRNWNPAGGDLAYGGRLGWTLALPGAVGRGLDVGASANVVTDAGDPVRQEVGADLRLRPVEAVVLTAYGTYSLYDARLAEATVRAGLTPTRPLLLELDYRFLAPDLFLARNSILSVFSASERQLVGGGVTYKLGRGFLVGGSYHLQLEPDDTHESPNFLGHEADARVEWEHGHSLVGLEGFYLKAFENGYTGGRLYGRQELGKAFAAADVLLHVFREDVNGQSSALTGTVSAGYRILRNLSAVLAGRAGMTPFLERSFDVLVKLVYEDSYVKSEVR